MAQTAKDLGISESSRRRWMALDDVHTGRTEGVSSSERAELAELRRRNRVEVEILKRAGAYFARENIPKIVFPAGPGTGRRRDPRRDIAAFTADQIDDDTYVRAASAISN